MTGTAEILDQLFNLLPLLRAEAVLVITIVLVVLSTLIRHIPRQIHLIIAITGVIVAAVSGSAGAHTAEQTEWFDISPASGMWRIVVDVTLAMVFIFRTDRHLRQRSGEYLVLLLMLLTGAHFLIISNHLFLTYLSVEVMSLSAYMLVALPQFKSQINSSFRYLVIGAVSSAVMLYGISLFYGLNGALSMEIIDPSSGSWQEPLGWVIVILITAGLLFKVAAVPFHMWVPDVYMATPIPVLSAFSTIPKVAAFVFLMKWVEAVPLDMTWLIGALAILTLIAGNFGALRQDNIRRLLGFSAIAHTGFMLAGLMPGVAGFDFLAFYLIIYILMTLGAFLLLNHYELNYGTRTVQDISGLSSLSSFRTIAMVIWMIALTGLPPTAGFSAKLFLFSGLASSYAASADVFILIVLVFAVLNAVVSLAYYLKIPYWMIFRKPGVIVRYTKNNGGPENFLQAILVLGVLILFFKPEWLMGWINNVSFVP